MAKHAHRLILNQKKTWRCTLPGCNYFIHVGLDHILAGKRMKCFSCSDEFTVAQSDVDAAKNGDDMLTCNSCKFTERTGISKEDNESFFDMVDLKAMIFRKYKTNQVSEVAPDKIKSMIDMGVTNQRAVDRALNMEMREKNEKSPISPSMKSLTPSKPEHRDDCASLYSAGLKCDCKDEVDYE